MFIQRCIVLRDTIDLPEVRTEIRLKFDEPVGAGLYNKEGGFKLDKLDGPGASLYMEVEEKEGEE